MSGKALEVEGSFLEGEAWRVVQAELGRRASCGYIVIVAINDSRGPAALADVDLVRRLFRVAERKTVLSLAVTEASMRPRP